MRIKVAIGVTAFTQNILMTILKLLTKKFSGMHKFHSLVSLNSDSNQLKKVEICDIIIFFSDYMEVSRDKQ